MSSRESALGPDNDRSRGGQDEPKDKKTSCPVGDPAIQEFGARKGRAQQVQVECAEDQPPTRRVDPELSAKAVGDQHEEQGGKQDGALGTRELEMDQAAARYRRREQKCDLRLGKGQGSPFVREHPGK